jgi:hypothetical protein
MTATDPFTRRRVSAFVETFRARSGQLPSLRDFEEAGFARALVDSLVREKFLVQLYVTLTNGTVIKGYKVERA